MKRERRKRRVAHKCGNRLRISLMGATTAAAATVATTATSSIVKIPNPKYLILAIPDCLEKRFSAHDRETLSMARKLADEEGGAVCMLCFCEAPNDPGGAGCDRLLVVPNDETTYSPDADAANICSLLPYLRPRHILFPDSQKGGDLGRRVVAELEATAATSVWQANLQYCERLRGQESARMPTPFIILAISGSCPPINDKRYEARPLEIKSSLRKKSAFTRISVSIPAPNQIPISEADFILAGGDGVRDWGAYHALATKLGATEGGSRVVVDKGHLPANRQIGSTGTITKARVYVAIGISGAPQHLQGIADCENVIAINSDSNCDMMRRADVAIVGDAQKIMKELLQILNA